MTLSTEQRRVFNEITTGIQRRQKGFHGKTHWAECHMEHVDCAILKLIWLVRQLDDNSVEPGRRVVVDEDWYHELVDVYMKRVGDPRTPRH